MSHIRLLIRRCFSSKSIQTYQFLRENPLRILVLLIIILFIVYEYQTVLRRTKVQDFPQNLPVNRQELSKNDEENSSEKKKKEYERYCNEWLQSLNTALAEYIERVGHSTEEDGDSELRALSQPLFTKKKLVVWAAELHSGPITDLKSLIGPLGVRFIDHSLDMGHCHQFCNCGAHRGLRILTPKNALMFYNRHIRQFHEAYRYGADPETAQVDAYFSAHPFAYFQLYQPFNRSQIVISSTRYEATRDNTPGWLQLNTLLLKLASVPHNVVGANNLYDREYIRYFTNLKPDYLSSLCLYTRASYQPTRLSFLFSALRGTLEGAFKHLWNTEFNAAYAKRNARFRLERVRERYPNDYTYADLASHLGIVNVPYQVSTMSIFEAYGMNIPMFFPSLDLLTAWHHEFYFMNERTWDGVGGRRPWATYIQAHEHFRNSTVPHPHNEWERDAIRYWLRYSDYYNLPHILHFASVEQLVEMLESYSLEPGLRRLRVVSEAMRTHNRERLVRALRYWRAKLTQIANNSPNRPH